MVFMVFYNVMHTDRERIEIERVKAACSSNIAFSPVLFVRLNTEQGCVLSKVPLVLYADIETDSNFLETLGVPNAGGLPL